ncbi:MAG: DNA translocase FtsK, partial [Clostridia bacterium]|nr:DNA translocase FtsK [Clostridia bacterium]
SMDLSELNEDVAHKRDQLENALETFGIPAKVIEVVVGPAVTRYELEMPAGISVKKILAHTDDIALNLAANGDIRIEAPIPGKSAVGIEVPNERIATVGLRDIISSSEFQNNNNPLTFVLGKDIAGSVKLCNLAKMPHLLVAGSTGSGKSVCLNAVILSLIYKTSPDDVRLILIDPKQVEFSIYNGLPHLLIPNVITDSDKALNALNWAVNEMERRYSLFKNTRTKDIIEYWNTSDVLEGRSEKIPYIVIIIDELADLLMTSKKDVEEKIARLAQKARAAGIHLILATQRPSVDVITGTMKNNFTSRITFKLMSFADSKTILDQGGAEKLLGKGDMLYKPSDASEPRRIQGCYVTSTEVANIVDFVKENNSEYDYDDKVETQIMNPPHQDIMSAANGEPINDTGFDPLMPQALKCVIENGQASISMLQRRLVIGYPRAARIIDQMQEKNFISPQDGSKPRSVLITMEEYEELFGEE